MGKLMVFRSFAWFLIFSFLHLQLAPFATAGKGPFEGDPPPSASPRGAKPSDFVVDEEVVRGGAHSLEHACPRAPVDPQGACRFLALLPPLLEQSSSRLMGASFHTPSGQLYQEEKDLHSARLAHMAVGAGALATSFAIILLFLTNASTGTLFTGSDDIGMTANYPWQVILASGFSGGFTLPKTALLLQEEFGKSPNSLHFTLPFLKKQDPLKLTATLTAGSAFVILTTINSAYAYGSIFLVPPFPPATLETFGVIAAVPYAGKLLIQEIGNFCRLFPAFVHSSGAKLREWRGLSTEVDLTRIAVHKRFAQSLRKLKKDSEAANALKTQVEALQQAVKEKTASLFQRLKGLKMGEDRLEGDEKTERKAQIKILQEQIDTLHRQGAAITIKLLYDFTEANTYPAVPHAPWWYRAAQATGAVGLGGLASGAIWYGLASIPASAGASPILSYAIGSVASAGFVPWMMKMGADFFSKTVSVLGNYNPVQHENEILDPTITRDAATVSIALLHPFVSTFESLPAALVGGAAMGYGLGSGAPAVPLNLQWWTLGPSMGAFGAADHNSSGPRWERFARRIQKKRGTLSPAQEMADLLGMVASWIRLLPDKDLMQVAHLLDRDIKDWVVSEGTAAREPEGELEAALGPDLRRHSGSSASGGTSTTDSPPKTGLGSRAPTPPSRTSSDGSGGPASGAETASLPGVEEDPIPSEGGLSPSPDSGRSAPSLETQGRKKAKLQRSSAGDVELEDRGVPQTDSVPAADEIEPSGGRFATTGARTFEKIVPTGSPGQITQGHRGRSASLSQSVPSSSGRESTIQAAPVQRERGTSLQAPQGNRLMRGLRALGNAFSSEGSGQESALEKPLIEGEE